MIFKYGPIELICSFSIILSELVKLEIGIKVHNFQTIANDFNRTNSLCFRNVCKLLIVFFFSVSASLGHSDGLVLSKSGPIGFIMTF